MNSDRLKQRIGQLWDDEVIPELTAYIRIPNKSPMFDPDWAAHGHMDAAVAQFERWARAMIAALPGARAEVVRLEWRTPVILIDIPGQSDETILLYGHLDKQPEMTGWAEGLGPWTPVLKGDKLYGRGGADDGYALFSSLVAILALHEQAIPHARCVILIEACEESGSHDLPFYVEHLAGRLGTPSLVVCLDSGCGGYDRLWLTTSLRGMISGTLSVQVLEEGVHSGKASGIVPSSFRILRQLLSRLEDEATGAILPPDLHATIPQDRVEKIRRTVAVLGDEIHTSFPFVAGMRPVSDDLNELMLNGTWRPQLVVTGADGLPAIQSAGNVLRPQTAVKLAMRLPPTLSADRAVARVRQILESDPPYGARVRFEARSSASGWVSPTIAPWLEASLDRASRMAFGKSAAFLGEGGSIPFISMLGEKFPYAQFMITGVLGPHSNAHGPNEFLHIPAGKGVTAAVAQVLMDHFNRVA